jgi:hypothetical protein
LLLRRSDSSLRIAFTPSRLLSRPLRHLTIVQSTQIRKIQKTPTAGKKIAGKMGGFKVVSSQCTYTCKHKEHISANFPCTIHNRCLAGGKFGTPTGNRNALN